jgi:hypothetical protein
VRGGAEPLMPDVACYSTAHCPQRPLPFAPTALPEVEALLGALQDSRCGSQADVGTDEPGGLGDADGETDARLGALRMACWLTAHLASAPDVRVCGPCVRRYACRSPHLHKSHTLAQTL